MSFELTVIRTSVIWTNGIEQIDVRTSVIRTNDQVSYFHCFLSDLKRDASTRIQTLAFGVEDEPTDHTIHQMEPFLQSLLEPILSFFQRDWLNSNFQTIWSAQKCLVTWQILANQNAENLEWHLLRRKKVL